MLDWEFAHAGHPWTDLGNVLRFDRHAAYVGAALAAWIEPARRHGRTTLLDGARAADLWALVDLAARERREPGGDPRRRPAARRSPQTGDLHAWPARDALSVT